jgi:predicted phage terminase large subunit-like protein
VGGLNRETMVLDVVEADICRRVPDLIISRALDLQLEYGCLTWAVETVQFQAFLYSELIKRGAQRGISFPGIPVMPSTDKGLRIISLQPHVSNGLIRLHRNQTTLIEQLKFWPEADHDDGPDCLEMLDTIARQYGGEWSYTSAANYRGRNAPRRTSRAYKTSDWDDDGD